MMTSHGKLRREKGSLAEYESQMKGKAACMYMCASPCVGLSPFCASVYACGLTCTHECV